MCQGQMQQYLLPRQSTSQRFYLGSTASEASLEASLEDEAGKGGPLPRSLALPSEASTVSKEDR